jgi:hypothetical protein
MVMCRARGYASDKTTTVMVTVRLARFVEVLGALTH